MSTGSTASSGQSRRRGPYAYWVDRLFFDESAYLATYPEVVPAVRAGVVKSGYDHYRRLGKWEGRTYPVRTGIVGALLGLALWLDAIFWLRLVLSPWQLCGRFRDEGHRLVLGGGPRLMQGYRAGPWRARLLPWQRTRWVIAEIRVEAQAASVQCVFQPLGADGARLGEPQSLECVSRRLTKRVLALPEGTTGLELRPSLDGTPARPLSVRVKPLSERRARELQERRVHRFQAGGSAFLGLSREALWTAYEDTFPIAARPSYRQWLLRVEAPELERLDREAPDVIAGLAARPLVSVLVPTYETDATFLRECLDSVLAQSYPHWELCIVDDASKAPHVREILEAYRQKEPRISLRFREHNGHISRASQDALTLAKGEFVALLDHDDVLCRHALLCVVLALQHNPEARLVYSDEDKLSATGERRQPHFKPDFDPERLLGQNYIAHLLVAKRADVLGCGGFREGFEGSQDHDLVLRLTRELTPGEIAHVPKVLYHWRESPASTAADGEAKPYALQAGLRAVEEAVAKQHRRATVEFDERGRCYRVRWALPDPAPKVTLIVPTRDAVELLSQCVNSVLDKTDYPDFELLIVDNGSRQEKTLRYFERVVDDPRVRVIAYDRPFNFSAINNFAAKRATGSVLALVNNDIEVIDGSWLREMVSLAVRPDIGCVGAKLLYPDGRIQHAGVVLGIGGVAGHAFKYSPGDSLGAFSKLCMTHSVSAVTAACLVVQRAIFFEVGGLDEEGLQVAFNDVDFCIRVRDAGYRNLLAPHAVLIHHESATRGSDHDESRRERFANEQKVMHRRHGKALLEDPFYSPNLTLEHEDFSLRAR